MSIKDYRSLCKVGVGIACLLLLIPAASQAQCATPTDAFPCGYYFPGSVLTAYAEGPHCFDMNYGEVTRVVAADDDGLFPRQWMFWTNKHPWDTSEFAYPCKIRETGNHLKVNIPDALHCGFSISTGKFTYYEFFVSMPQTGCVGWVECRKENY